MQKPFKNLVCICVRAKQKYHASITLPSELIYNLSCSEMFLFSLALLTLDVFSSSLFASTEEKLKLANSRDSDLWLLSNKEACRVYVTCLQLSAHWGTQIIECLAVRCAIRSTPVTFREDGVTVRWAWFKYGGTEAELKIQDLLLFWKQSKLQQHLNEPGRKKRMRRCD